MTFIRFNIYDIYQSLALYASSNYNTVKLSLDQFLPLEKEVFIYDSKTTNVTDTTYEFYIQKILTFFSNIQNIQPYERIIINYNDRSRIFRQKSFEEIFAYKPDPVLDKKISKPCREIKVTTDQESIDIPISEFKKYCKGDYVEDILSIYLQNKMNQINEISFQFMTKKKVYTKEELSDLRLQDVW